MVTYQCDSHFMKQQNQFAIKEDYVMYCDKNVT
jgi:hypothetical protein